MTKLKTTLASVAVAAGMATPLWIQLNANSELDVAQIELSQLHEELDGLQSENLSLSSQQAGEISGLTEAERFELLQLRGGVNSLRRQVEELLAKAETSESADQEDDEQTDKGSVLSVASYTSNISARVELGDTLITGGWEIEPGRKGYFVLSPHINFQNGDPASVTVSETILEITEELLESSGFPRPPAESDAETSSITMKTEDFQLVLERLMNDQFKRRGSERPAMQTTSGIGVVDLENPNGISTKKVIGTEIQINGESQFIGQTITYLPTVSLDGSFVNLNAVVDWNQLKPSEEQAR